jgi:hypothetical protein
MDYKEIQNDNIQAALIKVQTLQKEYEVTLQQYQESGKNYINSLKNTSEAYSNSPEYTALQGRTWWADSGISEGTVDTQEECENMCSTSDNCTGATFNPVKRYCWARTGDGSVSAGTDSDYALIPKQKAAIIVMKGLNDKLLNINQQITNELKNINPDVEKQSQEKQLKQQQLNESYQKLLEQKMEMEKQLQDYYSIEEDNENQSLYVNQQNVSLRFLVLITCLILIVTLKKIYGVESASVNVIIKVLIGIILLILTYSLSSPAGFAMWFIVLLIVVLIVILKNQNQAPSL